ncbi:SusD/RagB family nutrient-binding outer membrane lipoprotein [Aquimarina sp. ERC-38]|uniref:SusD/RagB family nutrient-binding outer membrane lipoprotein n=1 Tax=Aquimarina sp. ERC-38 TaxID=2949996 RepID=UPI0022457FA4|nr:SusD/RagB family nutrient-binding outer membrane lipoprotein [Aquimarina sp. ERC-38]UZO81317.1 SusD/RagB family nutrient-binding outer membrane lipoprotein [Aquimarina sp. ERC-38]
MKILFKYTTIIALLLLSGCEESLEEININPNQSVENPSLDLLFGAIVPGMIGQLVQSYEVPGQLAQQIAVKNSEVGTLTHDEDAISRRFWETVYSENNGALRNAGFLIFEAEERGNQVYQALGKILKAYILSYTTDLFGDIPYTDAAQGFRFGEQYIFPKYDAQSEVYRAMLSDLREANTLLETAAANQRIDESRDLLFKGDKGVWRKFANSLRLRLLMRISEVQDVQAEIATLFENPGMFPIFESIEETPQFVFEDITRWPFQPERVNSSDIRLSSIVVDIMKGEGNENQISTRSDPRLSFIVDPTETSVANGTPEFIGQPVGIASDIEEDANRSLLSSAFRTLNTFWLMTYAELLFIKSEAIHKGFITGNAQEVYRNGVLASITKYGIDETTAESIAYLEEVGNNFVGNEIKHLAIQRWLDQVNNGFEGYSVWRRMNHPILTPGQDAVAPQIPLRYFYSSKTTDKNQVNADEAINRPPLNGRNTTFQKVWWDRD